ncbi:MAG: hypothetical protein UF228_07505 [Lachnospiraceae bacterium]|nr:hypothetical protein [Lachnospiraceae bacterium]
MTDNRWRLYSLEKPDKDGVYRVRLTKRNDLLSSPIESIVEYVDGEWIVKIPMLVKDYVVYAWAYR